MLLPSSLDSIQTTKTSSQMYGAEDMADHNANILRAQSKGNYYRNEGTTINLDEEIAVLIRIFANSVKENKTANNITPKSTNISLPPPTRFRRIRKSF